MSAAKSWMIVPLLAAVLSCGSGDPSLAPAEARPYLAFDGARALQEVERQVAFGPRVPGAEGHAAAAGYFEQTLAALADTVLTQRWTHQAANGQSLPLVNVIASFGPEKARRVLLCAHWDTRPVADHDPDPARRDQPIPGANDGGSGVAVLLELARVFAREAPSLGVDLVLFDGEDYGDFGLDRDVLIGSRHFAAGWQDYRPELGILLDMVGDQNGRFPIEGNSWAVLPDQCRLVWGTAAQLGYGRQFPNQIGPAVIDDHIPLLEKGIRCIDLIQMGLPYWHTHGDTPDQLSAATLEAVGRTVAAVVYGLR